MSLVCWDKLLRSTQDMQELIQRLFDAGIPVEGIVGFGLDEAQILDSVLQPVVDQDEDNPAASVVASAVQSDSVTFSGEKEASGSAGENAGAEVGATPATATDRPNVTDDRGTAEVSAAVRAAGASGPSAGAGEPKVTFPRQARAGQRTSTIFWAAATLLVAICAVIIILWVRMQDLPDSEREPTLAQQAPETDITRAATEPSGSAPAESLTSASLLPATRASDLTADALTGDAESDPAASSSRQATSNRSETVVQADADVAGVGAGQAGDDDAGQPTTQPPPTEPAVPDQQKEGSSTADSPYSVPVGQAGWAIHLYSLPDEASTVKEAAELERKGFQTTWRLEDVPGKGRYYRIYVGSFPSAAAARKALPELKERLRVKWAQVRQF
jgi:hypothetical protein